MSSTDAEFVEKVPQFVREAEESLSVEMKNANGLLASTYQVGYLKGFAKGRVHSYDKELRESHDMLRRAMFIIHDAERCGLETVQNRLTALKQDFCKVCNEHEKKVFS